MANTNGPAILFRLAIAIHYTTATATLSFSAYPINSQQCLYNAADASGCPTEALTVYDINYCLCGNGGNFVINSLRCVAAYDPDDSQIVWNTIVWECSLSSTPLQHSEADYLGQAAASASPSTPPTPQSSVWQLGTTSPSSASPTQSIYAGQWSVSAQQQPHTFSNGPSRTIPTSTASFVASRPTISSPITSNPAKNDFNQNNNRNNGSVGSLSGSTIALISAVSGLVATIGTVATIWECCRRRRNRMLYA